MAGFIRRYGFFPGTEQITQIEGVVIIDLPPPGSVQGVGVGTVGLVGEFSDMTYATQANSAGVVSTLIQPQEVLGSKDLIDRFGGYDHTLGEHGISLGNGFLALRNKRFSRLVLAALNLCSAQGARFFRQLPLCTSPTDAAPVVPMQGATIQAGMEFRVGVARFKIGKRVEFSARGVIATGVGGDLAAAASAATQTFNAAAGFDWTLIDRGDGSLGARKGDVLVIGNNNAGAIQPAEAGTYRVAADPSSGIAIVLERLDGSSFAFTAQTNVSWRLHHSTDADTALERVVGSALPGGYDSNDDGGFTVPVRPLTNATGANVTGTHAAGALLVPAVVPTPLTGDSADALSGLGGRLHPTTPTVFTAAVQGINAPGSSDLEAGYATALDAMLGEQTPMRDVNIILAARKSTAIANKLRSHALKASELGRGRSALISPALSTYQTSQAVATAAPGVGATRHERVWYAWPGCIHQVPEAVNLLTACADGTFTLDGILDETMDHWVAGLLSMLPPERNPGQASSPVPEAFASILGIQRKVGALQMSDYILLRSNGIMALRLDRTSGPIIQSGVTSSLISGQKNVSRRRMADFIEDSLAERLVQISKEPMSQSLKDDATVETVAFLSELLSENNPAAQRISGFVVDDKSGNTPDLEAKGIFVIIARVRTIPSADFIVIQAEIGENVTVTAE